MIKARNFDLARFFNDTFVFYIYPIYIRCTWRKVYDYVGGALKGIVQHAISRWGWNLSRGLNCRLLYALELPN